MNLTFTFRARVLSVTSSRAEFRRRSNAVSIFGSFLRRSVTVLPLRSNAVHVTDHASNATVRSSVPYASESRMDALHVRTMWRAVRYARQRSMPYTADKSTRTRRRILRCHNHGTDPTAANSRKYTDGIAYDTMYASAPSTRI